MQQKFLEYVLEDLQRKKVALDTCTFVLPSKRSGIFLKKYISSILSKNIFSPKILSIEDFVLQIAELKQISNIELLLEFYKVYKSSKIKAPDDFYTFLKWGQTLLQDFNEIDRYLIPPKDILNYLSAIKELNHWSLKKEKTELIQTYLNQWNNLESLYNSLTKSLLSQKKGYQGLIYREAAKNVTNNYDKNEHHTIVFVGFNALNTAESNIIQYFLVENNSYIYWDIDSYFLDDKIHDAGIFIRNYKRDWPYYKSNSLKGIHNTYISNKNISITGVPKNVSQAKYVGELLRKIHSKSTIGLKDTALVLSDENLLNPILNAIPSEIKETNITMGIPLAQTILYSFFLTFLELNEARTEKGWFYKDVLKFFSNPHTLILLTSEQKNFAEIISRDIKRNNLLYFRPRSGVANLELNRILNYIFPLKKVSPQFWISNCLSLIEALKEIYQKENKTLELEHLYRFYKLFNQLDKHVKDTGFIKDLKSIKSFFKQLAAIETLDFIGEPLSGLQIMGMLESRNLDFETIIITSVNEGILPSGKSNNSFIPFDVKREYGLPTYKEKDAIYTYHFYRLIQRAKNVYITYNTEPDVLEGGERSRLINQLLTDENINQYTSHNIASPTVYISQPTTPEIIKSPSLFKAIKTFAENGFSPTALTNYIRNPLEFYKKNILKINDIDQVEETIAANTFGTIVHDSLEELYKPFIGKILITEAMVSMKLGISATVKKKFEQNLSGADVSKGKFLLVYRVIVKYIERFVDMEIEQIQEQDVKILGLEEKYSVMLNFPELDFPIKLKGTLDRIDKVNGVLRIIDYKTGKVEPKNVKVVDWEELITDYDKSKAFQLLCYAYLYSKENNALVLQAGIYSFKNLGQGFQPFINNDITITPDILDTFEKYLKKLILEICDLKIPFVEKKV